MVKIEDTKRSFRAMIALPEIGHKGTTLNAGFTLLSAINVPALFVNRQGVVLFSTEAAKTALKIPSFAEPPKVVDIAECLGENVLSDLDNVFSNAPPVAREIKIKKNEYVRNIAMVDHHTGLPELACITFQDTTDFVRANRRMNEAAARDAALAHLGKLALNSDNIENILDTAAELAAKFCGADMAEILLNEGHDRMRIVSAPGMARGIARYTVLPVTADELPGLACHSESPIWTHADGTGPKLSVEMEDSRAVATLSTQIGPLAAARGVLVVGWRRPKGEDKSIADFAETISELIWIALTKREIDMSHQQERRRARELINGLPILIGVGNRDGSFELSNDTFERIGFSSSSGQEPTLADVLGERDANGVMGFMASHPKKPVTVEHSVTLPRGGERTYVMQFVPRFGDYAQGFFFSGIDIDERKKSEELNRTISAELDHRVKNILSLVTSIAYFTGQNTDDIDEFNEVFAERIGSLARTHAALAACKWTAISLGAVLNSELSAYVKDNDRRITIVGPDVQLNMRASQSFALALHELTTNAVKYGAFSIPDGRLTVKWERKNNQLELEWIEEGRKSQEGSLDKHGFGQVVIRTSIVDQLKGTIEQELSENGLRARISVPLAQLS